MPARESARPETVDEYLEAVPDDARKGHCGLYVMSSDVMCAHAAELEDHELGKTTIRFPADKPLPAPLVTKLVKARIAENEAGGHS
jgi:uncharacterized protein YdhG (YjbR/CyaY superfamily)